MEIHKERISCRFTLSVAISRRFFRLFVHIGVHVLDALDAHDGPEFRFSFWFCQRATNSYLIFTILARNLFTEQNCGSNEFVTTHERTRGQKNSACDICRPSGGGGTFFVIKRSEIPEKASSRIKRTADIKVQSEIRRLRKKRDERRKRWLLFARQMAV